MPKKAAAKKAPTEIKPIDAETGKEVEAASAAPPEPANEPAPPGTLPDPEAPANPDGGKPTEEDTRAQQEVEAASNALLEAKELADELEAEKAELTVELEEANTKLATMSAEKANAELVGQLAQVRESLAEREATIVELSKPLTKEAFQKIAAQNPGWIPAKVPGLSTKDYMRRCAAVADKLHAHLVEITNGELAELRAIQRKIRTSGLDAD